jgi:hypothetical protein
MANTTLVIGVTGIVVSGIIGPGTAALISQRSQTNSFNRSLAAERRGELRALLDQAAVLLASGATNLRILQDLDSDQLEMQRAKEWMMEIFPIGQRLELWLPHDDPVVVAYAKVREQLVSAAGVSDSLESEAQLQQFEADRREFLNLSRAKLLAPIEATAGAE